MPLKNLKASESLHISLLISGFGKLSVKNKRERRGRNPQTSKDLILKPRKVVVFKASGVLRGKINSKRKVDRTRQQLGKTPLGIF